MHLWKIYRSTLQHYELVISTRFSARNSPCTRLLHGELTACSLFPCLPRLFVITCYKRVIDRYAGYTGSSAKQTAQKRSGTTLRNISHAFSRSSGA